MMSSTEYLVSTPFVSAETSAAGLKSVAASSATSARRATRPSARPVGARGAKPHASASIVESRKARMVQAEPQVVRVCEKGSSNCFCIAPSNCFLFCDS